MHSQDILLNDDEQVELKRRVPEKDQQGNAATAFDLG